MGELRARRRLARPRFFAGVEHRDQMHAALVDRHAAEWQSTCEEAARARNRTVSLFGTAFDLGTHVGWQRDPQSNRQWPAGWHATIPLGGAGTPGDIKYVWELNRHQFLIALAKRHWVTQDAADAAEVLTLVRDWIATNPYGCGVNWTNPLEPAYRSLSWLWSYYLCFDALDDETHALWLAAFHDHARFLHRHLELYASPFNHLIGEAAALYVLGVLFPEFRDAAAWRRRGRQVLESRLGEQFYRDGGSVEQATCYHHATLGFYLVAALLGRANGDELAPAVWAAIERAIEFSMHLVQPDGRLPAIGDNDDANPLTLTRRSVWDFRVFQALGAVLFDRPDFKYVARGFPVDALWLLGPQADDRFAAIPQRPPDDTSKALRESGYFVLRSDWSDKGDYACVDCGEQAGGLRQDAIPSAAHGHADCLSLTVFLRGQPVLVDAGYYTYNGDEAWERFFRETAAHNTARIDGRDQARHLAKMAWSHVPRARLEGWMSDGTQAWVRGSHDGYARGQGGVVHRRTVWLRPGGYVLLYDEFLGEGEHDVELNFQLTPIPIQAVERQALRTVTGPGVWWSGSQPVRASLVEGGAGAGDGWIAPALGARVPAPRLTLSSRIRRGHEGLLTIVADFATTTVTPASTVSDACALPVAAIVSTGEYVDHIVATDGRPTIAGGCQTDASIAVWRSRGGCVVETARVGGGYLTVREIGSRDGELVEAAPVS